MTMNATKCLDLFQHLKDEHEVDYETKKWVLCAEVGSTEKLKKMNHLVTMRTHTCLRLVPMDWFS